MGEIYKKFFEIENIEYDSIKNEIEKQRRNSNARRMDIMSCLWWQDA